MTLVLLTLSPTKLSKDGQIILKITCWKNILLTSPPKLIVSVQYELHVSVCSMSSTSASPAVCSVTCSSDSLSVSFYRCPQTWTHSHAFKMTVASSFLHWNSNNRSTVTHLHWYLKVQMSSSEPHMHHCDSVHWPYAQPRAADTAVGRNVTLESELPWSREARNTHTQLHKATESIYSPV